MTSRDLCLIDSIFFFFSRRPFYIAAKFHTDCIEETAPWKLLDLLKSWHHSRGKKISLGYIVMLLEERNSEAYRCEKKKKIQDRQLALILHPGYSRIFFFCILLHITCRQLYYHQNKDKNNKTELHDISQMIFNYLCENFWSSTCSVLLHPLYLCSWARFCLINWSKLLGWTAEILHGGFHVEDTLMCIEGIKLSYLLKVVCCFIQYSISSAEVNWLSRLF